MTVVIPAAREPVADFSASRVLVVDPYLATQRLIRDMLNTLGVGEAGACGDDVHAWKMLDDGEWNVMFLNWSSRNDALAFLHTLRHPENPHRFLPVSVMSGFDQPAHVRHARDAGATEYMLVPFSHDVLLSRLRSIVQHPRLFVSAGPFFGPDRRRRRVEFTGPEQRRHQNWRCADRRRGLAPWQGPERRQGRPGYAAPERRTGARH